METRWKKREKKEGRERILDTMGRYIGKEEGIVQEETKVLSLLLGRKKFHRALVFGGSY